MVTMAFLEHFDQGFFVYEIDLEEYLGIDESTARRSLEYAIKVHPFISLMNRWSIPKVDGVTCH